MTKTKDDYGSHDMAGRSAAGAVRHTFTRFPGSQESTQADPTANGLTCLLCGGRRHRVAFREFDIDILRCRACGHVFSSYEADPHYDGFWGDEVADADHYWSIARQPMYQ